MKKTMSTIAAMTVFFTGIPLTHSMDNKSNSNKTESYVEQSALDINKRLLTNIENTVGVSIVDVWSEEWAKITYQQSKEKQEKLLKTLYQKVKVDIQQNEYNSDADALTWLGIITASYAGAKGGIGALKLAKEAKGYLEKALSINENALDGGAQTSLGTLYHRVPPWPLGFGNKKKAARYLIESYQKHPKNMDVLFFYADYLLSENQQNEAKEIFLKAASLPIREYRQIADLGRQAQIKDKLSSMK